MRIISKIFGVIAGMSAMPALAQDGLEIIGIPIDRGLGFQPAVTELARDLQWLDAMILYIITAIVVFVTALMGYVIIRYNRRANPNPGSFTHLNRDRRVFPASFVQTARNSGSGFDHQGNRQSMVLGL